MTLYEECLEALGEYVELSDDQSQIILDAITSQIEFTWYERIDFNKIENKKRINSFDELRNIKNKEVYLFWDIEKHILKTKLSNIVNAWDDVEALGTRVWIISIKMDFFLEYYEELWLGYK
uniref:CDI toxin immunity protein n=1 Tax=Ornithobacterium rhinotracheale TaxID=28251 RepID=UPI00129D0C9D|nr:hypothetical protein [Ornithobacterium rhinotracheale]